MTGWFYRVSVRKNELLQKFLLRRPLSSATSCSDFGRLFWGEQPPFTPIGRGGRYFFGVNQKTTLNVQRPTPNVEVRNVGTLFMASCLNAGGFDSRRWWRFYFLA